MAYWAYAYVRLVALRLSLRKYPAYALLLVSIDYFDCNTWFKTKMEFVKYNVIRRFLTPHYGKSLAEKCKILWTEGWEKNPIPTLTVVAFPFMVIHGTWEYFRHDRNHPRKMKYLKDPPIYRPGDPRIAEIQHESILDK